MNAASSSFGPIPVYVFKDYNFQVFEGAERLLSEYRIVCNSIYHTKNEENNLPILPLILLPEQVQILVENGFAEIRSTIGTSSFEGDPHSIIENEIKNEENTIFFRDLARRILIGKKLKVKKEASSLDEPIVKMRKLNWQKYARDEQNEQIFELDELEVEKTIEELKMRELSKSTKQRLLKYYGHPNNYVVLSPPYSSSFPQSLEYLIKVIVFRDLWRKGFYLSPGVKFGCDYLAYVKPPGQEHAKYMVVCVDANKTFKPLDVLGISRMGTQVNKRILLAVVNIGTLLPYYLEMNWWKGDGTDDRNKSLINA